MLVIAATFQSPILPYVVLAAVGFFDQSERAFLMSVMAVRWAAAVRVKISSSRAGLKVLEWRAERRGEGIVGSMAAHST
jgi:hypothetical protein